MKVKVLGSGCSNCKRLEKNIKKAAKELKLDIELEKVTEIEEIMNYNVISTPGLVVDDKVISSGKVLSIDEIKMYLS
ncbi:MAG: thioredoxin family protein [Candidatus Izimaplasma sp.]|nr:thioredoxin family protein [Candidatus Izimaplasma bacterium]